MSATARQSSKSKMGKGFAPVSLIDSRVFNNTTSNVSESQLEHDFGRDQTHSQLNSQSEEDGFFNGGTTPLTHRQTSEFASGNLPLDTIVINQIFTKATSDYKGNQRELEDLMTSNMDSICGSKEEVSKHIFSGPREFLVSLKQKMHNLQLEKQELLQKLTAANSEIDKAEKIKDTLNC